MCAKFGLSLYCFDLRPPVDGASPSFVISFLSKSKKEMIEYLKESSIPTEAVEPTLVYGEGRSDSLSKMVPLLKFFGIFSKNMKPVPVTDVADELVSKMMKH